MCLVNKILNVFLPPAIFLCLLLLSPLLLFFKLCSCMRRYRNAENVAGKAVIITGASSGIGEQLAYEYARRGARLALVARREDLLLLVADKSRRLGSPDVIVKRGDVSVVEDCKRFVEETVNHFGQLDHLVNNAGIAEAKMFEDYSQISDAATIMNTNFWGPVSATHFAVPHLKRSKGKIVAVASPAGWSAPSRMSIYGASKAAMINFYETLRIELGHEIGVTIVFPGLINNGVTSPDLIAERKDRWGFVPAESAATCARAILDAVRRGERVVTEPSWINVLFWLCTFCPQFPEWASRLSTKTRTKNE